MDEDFEKNGSHNYEEILHKNVKDIENKVQQLKNTTLPDDNALKDVNVLFDRTVQLKDKFSTVYFQYIKHSSVVIYEKKLKELIKEIESLKHMLIQNKNKKVLGVFNDICGDNFLIPENDSIENENENENESKELTDDWVDLNQHKLFFQNLQNERIIRGHDETECSSLILDNLVNCEVIILDVLSSVLIRRIKNCTIWVAVVESSILIYNCLGCNILSNSKQIRIHDTSETNFYINTMSSPIIENSNQLTFFQYNLNYDGLSELLKKNNINKNSNNWMEILDFNWQDTQEQSPNFSISKETQVYYIKLQKIYHIQNDQGQTVNGKYVIENFPVFLKKVD
ncbi:hypothetical protein PGO_081460 [Plasmodium gonderi]|uniref:C-CAP/cofactor C-like domain-containing protein n=1 Tax=Plasmodium gonderi TaxID=77519 RepID=A0A1Y1JE90_PLAGO|nr:hypothetical protein PGO_081460 [Plasmodium gonderi]GAW80580.1 hypothetical protein PGO_081460 [Plasmodium gonderi]